MAMALRTVRHPRASSTSPPSSSTERHLTRRTVRGDPDHFGPRSRSGAFGIELQRVLTFRVGRSEGEGLVVRFKDDVGVRQRLAVERNRSRYGRQIQVAVVGTDPRAPGKKGKAADEQPLEARELFHRENS